MTFEARATIGALQAELSSLATVGKTEDVPSGRKQV
jgi:hypothetical protein